MSYQYNESDIIGRGGMGCVYKGRDPAGNLVAIKMMSNQVTCYPEYRAMFQSEVNALRKMNHPSVVRIVGDPFQDSAGNLFLPMEYVQGKTIEQYIHLNGPMRGNKAIQIMEMVLEAMQYVHEHGCIHRDIKPSNIMIRDDGRICIIDFGIAKDSEVGSSGKTVGRIIGTDGYMSPEQATGLNIDIRTDIYSLGCVFYFMLTGQHAITKRENDYKTVQAILNEEIPVPSHTSPGISEYLDRMFLKAVDKNMTKRYQTANEFKQALINPNPTIPTVKVGRAIDNDILINKQNVSKYHLVIRGKQITVDDPYKGSSTYPIIEVEDISRYGTGINGRCLHHATENIDFTATHNLPQVMLAGRPECMLNWSEVISRLKTQGWNKDITSTPPPTLPTPLPSNDSLETGWAIISFLFPIIGWILWAVWKEEHSERASQAAKWAWVGLAINIISIMILQNL